VGTSDEEIPERNLRQQLFKNLLDEINQELKTPLTIIVCGRALSSTKGEESSPNLRANVKMSLIQKGDNVSYLENLTNSDEGKEYQNQFEKELGRRPTLKELEISILRRPEIDKNIHLLESPGTIAELADFQNSPTVCRKCKVFVNSKYRNNPSYVGDLINRLEQNGAKIFWYDDENELVQNVETALKPNRLEKAERYR
jgi:hypothetical protein